MHLKDDIDGGPADNPTQFSLNGKDYEIDLSTTNTEKLREALHPSADGGRKTSRSGDPHPTTTAWRPSETFAGPSVHGHRQRPIEISVATRTLQ